MNDYKDRMNAKTQRRRDARAEMEMGATRRADFLVNGSVMAGIFAPSRLGVLALNSGPDDVQEALAEGGALQSCSSGIKANKGGSRQKKYDHFYLYYHGSGVGRNGRQAPKLTLTRSTLVKASQG